MSRDVTGTGGAPTGSMQMAQSHGKRFRAELYMSVIDGQCVRQSHRCDQTGYKMRNMRTCPVLVRFEAEVRAVVRVAQSQITTIIV